MPPVTDPARLRSILSVDRPWCVYALGDLSGGRFAQCEWHCPAVGSPVLVLIYRAFGAPVLFTVGPPGELEPLIDEAGPPRLVNLHVRPEMLPSIRRKYRRVETKPMLRMVLQGLERPFPPEGGAVTRLTLADVPQLQRLYADGLASGESPDFFYPSMVEDGIFYGAWEDKELVAAAGTHLVEPHESVAAVGNVYTRRDRRRLGLAGRVTGAVVTALVDNGISLIALNVSPNNSPAIRVYERLGFARYCSFFEGVAQDSVAVSLPNLTS